MKVYCFYKKDSIEQGFVEKLKTLDVKDGNATKLKNYMNEKNVVFIAGEEFDNARQELNKQGYNGFVLRNAYGKIKDYYPYNIVKLSYYNSTAVLSWQQLVDLELIVGCCYNCGAADTSFYKPGICTKCAQNPLFHKLETHYNGSAKPGGFDAQGKEVALKESKTTRLLRYIRNFDIEVLPSGHLLMYKAINIDNSSFHDNSFKYPAKGEYATQDKYDTDIMYDCGTGLHVANLKWVISHYGRSDRKIIECIVDPEDVVAIPYNTAGKIRVKRLQVGDGVSLSLVMKK